MNDPVEPAEPRIVVRSADPAVKSHREALAQRVLDYFKSRQFLPGSRLLCFLDDEDFAAARSDLGPANRAFYAPIHDDANFDGWPSYIKDLIFPWDFCGSSSTRAIDDYVYVHGSTCVDDVGLTISLAHELQHVIQHFKVRKLWAMNGLVTNGLSRATIEALRLEWADIPIEVEARIVSKRVAEEFYGEERVRLHIDKRLAEPATESDRRDLQFIRTLLPSMTIDLAGETRRLAERIKDHRAELDAAGQEEGQNPDYAAINLDAFFTG